VNAIPLPRGQTKFLFERSKRGQAIRREMLSYHERVFRLGETAFGKIDRLDPPSSLRQRWQRWLAEADAAHRAGVVMKRDLRRFVNQRIFAAGTEGDAWYSHSEAAYRLGRELGLRTCAITVRYRE
jgi:hypothetical protein